jgi:hypothetical protein
MLPTGLVSNPRDGCPNGPQPIRDLPFGKSSFTLCRSYELYRPTDPQDRNDHESRPPADAEFGVGTMNTTWTEGDSMR